MLTFVAFFVNTLSKYAMASLHTSQNAPDVFTGLTASMGVAGTRDRTSTDCFLVLPREVLQKPTKLQTVSGSLNNSDIIQDRLKLI